MNIKDLNIDLLKPYENNPRINDGAVDAVAASIKEFGFKQPIVIDADNVIVAGHTRLKAAQKIGLKTVPCIVADDLTPEQIKAFRVADNKTAELAEWDMELLESELEQLAMMDFDMERFGFEALEDDQIHDDSDDNTESKSLNDKFIVPPFSILDTRQGYWQTRKKAWKQIGIKSELGRKENLIEAPDLPEYATYGGSLKGVAPQTSIFDPVLCEVCYKWFNIENGNIYDCFAGGSVRGIIAAKLGYGYTGIDLRQEQVEANYNNASELNVEPVWFCDDSKNADKYVQDESVDMIFSCPPYADLEVYSDDPRDISNMEYADFCAAYKEIISIACRKLKQNRFAVFVVGDIRDKNGFYRNFVDYTKQCFNENGLLTYNELILVEQIGTAAMRVAPMFKNRKVAKTHQNVLVFFKGNPDTIKSNYNFIDVEDIVNEFAAE